jgi:hypothetical protein
MNLYIENFTSDKDYFEEQEWLKSGENLTERLTK